MTLGTRCRRAAILVGLALALVLAPGAGADAYFDSHVHLNDPGAQLALMARLGVTRAVVFWGHATDNPEVLEAARRNPIQLVPFLSVSPERERSYGAWWKASDPRLLRYVEAELARGVYRGIGELSIVHFPSRGFPETEYSPLHPLMRGIMELAARHRLPVMVHCETTYARELDQLLAAHPGVPVIWAHGGYASLYWTARILKAHPRLTIELSMRTVHGHPRSPDYWINESPGKVWPEWLALIEANPGRFIVGSDATQRDPATDEARVRSTFELLRQLTPGTRARVGYQNLDELLRPPPATPVPLVPGGAPGPVPPAGTTLGQ